MWKPNDPVVVAGGAEIDERERFIHVIGDTLEDGVIEGSRWAASQSPCETESQ